MRCHGQLAPYAHRGGGCCTRAFAWISWEAAAERAEDLRCKCRRQHRCITRTAAACSPQKAASAKVGRNGSKLTSVLLAGRSCNSNTGSCSWPPSVSNLAAVPQHCNGKKAGASARRRRTGRQWHTGRHWQSKCRHESARRFTPRDRWYAPAERKGRARRKAWPLLRSCEPASAQS